MDRVGFRVLGLLLCLTYGALLGLRWPQDYALTHLVIDYHFGFGKRGLPGALLEHIDQPQYHYSTLATMTAVVLVGWLLALVVGAWRLLRSDLGIWAALCLFFLSAGFASLVCDAGRGQHFALLLATPCLMMPVTGRWLAVRAVVLVASVLMQEANFLIVAPLVVFDVGIGLARRAFWPWLMAGLVLLPAMMLTAYLGSIRTACNTTAAVAYFQHMAADFRVEAVPVATLCMSGVANLRLVSTAIWSVPAQALPLALVVALPSTFLNLVLAARILASRRRAGLASAGLATAAPLGLLIVGADIVRFVTLMQITSLLVMLAAASRLGVPQGGILRGTPTRTSMPVAVTVFELGSSLTLTDGNPMLKFPFGPPVQQLLFNMGFRT